MGGFIDPFGPTKDRLERLETLVCEALMHVDAKVFSPEVQAIISDLRSENEVRQERARRAMLRAMDADPL